MNIDRALEMARVKMPAHRFQHCQGVADTARELAAEYGINPDQAYLAGLLHDYARDIPGDQLLDIAGAGGTVIDEIYRQVPDLLHGPAAAVLLRNELQIDDEEVLSAIKNHTLGGVGMNPLDQVLFIADMIEPGRDYPGVEELRVLAKANLEQAMVYGLNSTIRYCLDRGVLLHPRTIEVRNYFLQRMKDAKGKQIQG